MKGIFYQPLPSSMATSDCRVTSDKLSAVVYWKKALIKQVVPSSRATLNSGATLNSYAFSMKTHGIAFITAMSQGVCDLDRSLKVSTPEPQSFLNVIRPSTLFFCLNNNFQTKKFDALRRSFDWKLISLNISKDTQKHLFDLCMSHIFTVLSLKIWGNLR